MKKTDFFVPMIYRVNEVLWNQVKKLTETGTGGNGYNGEVAEDERMYSDKRCV